MPDPIFHGWLWQVNRGNGCYPGQPGSDMIFWSKVFKFTTTHVDRRGTFICRRESPYLFYPGKYAWQK